MSEAAGQKNPWDRWPGESEAAYARFTAYLNLGPSRTLAAAYGSTLRVPA